MLVRAAQSAMRTPRCYARASWSYAGLLRGGSVGGDSPLQDSVFMYPVPQRGGDALLAAGERLLTPKHSDLRKVPLVGPNEKS